MLRSLLQTVNTNKYSIQITRTSSLTTCQQDPLLRTPRIWTELSQKLQKSKQCWMTTASGMPTGKTNYQKCSMMTTLQTKILPATMEVSRTLSVRRRRRLLSSRIDLKKKSSSTSPTKHNLKRWDWTTRLFTEKNLRFCKKLKRVWIGAFLSWTSAWQK